MILDLQEKGVIQLLYNKWWKNVGTCIREDKNKEGKANALGVDNIGGVFVVLLGGLVIAIAGKHLITFDKKFSFINFTIN